MVGTTKSDHENPIQNTLIMQAENQRFTYDYRGGDNPTLIFGEDAYDASSWVTNGVRQRPQSTLNENDAASISLEYALNDNLTFKIGTDYKDFTFTTDQYVYSGGELTNCLPNPLPDAGCNVDIQAEPNYIIEYNSGLGADTPWLIPNRSLIMSDYELFDLPMSTNYGQTFVVNEETVGFYAQVDFNFDLGSVPVRGDIGVRRFETDQEGTGYDTVGVGYTVPHSYSDTLPSLNLVVEPVEDFLVRFAFSEGISRAGLAQLAPTTAVQRSGTTNTVNRGNPYLEPTKAKSYDLGFEWYFAEGAHIGLTLFEKDIESFVQTSRLTTTYTALMDELGLAEDAMIAACGSSYPAICNADSPWNYSVPFNSPGGDLSGYEVSYQQPFTFLPGVFSNFGAILAYTSVDADMDYLDTTGQIVLATKPLVNLSDETASATVYYEDDAFSARVSIVNRSEYLTAAIGRDGSDEEGTNSTTNVDASFGYQFNDNLKFTLEALNLTDEADDQWVSTEGQKMSSYYHTTGRQYYIGAQFKF
jgi:iron complex outermembrane receptor protein